MSREPQRGEDAGLTLIELLVVMLILGVVGAITVAGITRGLRTTAHAEDRVQTLAEVQTAIERIGREIRAGHPVREVAADRLVLDVCRDGDLHHHRYLVVAAGDSWELVQKRWDFDHACPDPDWSPVKSQAHTTTTRTLVARVTTDAVFTALDGDGGALSGSAADNAEDGHRVRVRVRRAVESAQDAIEAETTVMVRNR